MDQGVGVNCKGLGFQGRLLIRPVTNKPPPLNRDMIGIQMLRPLKGACLSRVYLSP